MSMYIISHREKKREKNQLINQSIKAIPFLLLLLLLFLNNNFDPIHLRRYMANLIYFP